MRSLLLVLLTALIFAKAGAQTVRVVTWDLASIRSSRPPTAAEATNHLRKAARVLETLDADFILLQSVSGWGAARLLAEFLQPAKYHVLACSSFNGVAELGQVAILGKTPARVSWSEPWTEPGGFAFAAVPVGKKMAGFFSVRFPDDDLVGETTTGLSAREAACQKLLQQVDALGAWQHNKTELLVIGGNFATSPERPEGEEEQTLLWLEEADFANAYQAVARENRLSMRRQGGQPEATLDYLFIRNGALPSAPRLVLAEGFLHRPVVCEIDPDRVSAPTAWVEQVRRSLAEARAAEARAAEALAQAQAAFPSRTPEPPLWVWWAGGIFIFLVGAFLLWWWRVSVRLHSAGLWALERPPARAYLESGAAPSTVAPEPELLGERSEGGEGERLWRERAEAAERRAEKAAQLVKQGMIPHLADWFKQTFLRRLIAQRKDLVDSQEHATEQVRALEEKVAQIHGGMQGRISMYERRIKELEEELAHAQSEKRDLIAARIRLAKEQLERARQEIPQRN